MQILLTILGLIVIFSGVGVAFGAIMIFVFIALIVMKIIDYFFGD